jgi:heat-inducible transcriptional repressor
MELNARTSSILEAVVFDHITTAEPVGSRTISKKYKFGLSPATIRNIMADLEELGYLSQPHTSAGRVPTDRAYRFYVDHLLNEQPFSKQVRNPNVEAALCAIHEFNDLMEEASVFLSQLSNQAGVVLISNLRKTVFKRIEFIHLVGSRVLVIFVVESGLVHKKTIELDRPISQSTLEKISNLVTEQMAGLTLNQIRKKLIEMMEEEKTQFDELLNQALRLSQKAFEDEQGESDIYVRGTLNILNQPEFADVDIMKTLFKAFEEKSILIQILDKCLDEDTEDALPVKITIGSENQISEMENCGLVTSVYKCGSYSAGVLGIIGPKRMDYSKVIPVVSYMSKLISKLLTNG